MREPISRSVYRSVQFVSLFMLLVASPPSHGQSSQDYFVSKEFSYRGVIPPFTYTIASKCRLELIYDQIKDFFNVKKEKFPKRPYFNDQVDLYLYLLKEGDRVASKPIVVFFPGTYSGLSAPQSKQIAPLLNELGYHVIITPNPWTKVFSKNLDQPVFGDIEREAQILNRSVMEAISYINLKYNLKGEKTKEVHTLSVSAGTLFAALFANQYQSIEGNPLNIQTHTMIAPPWSLRNSLVQLDNYLEDTKDLLKELKVYRSRDSDIWDNIGSMKSLLGSFAGICRSISTLSENNKELVEKRSKTMVAWVGFQKRVVGLIDYLKSAPNNWPVPEFILKVLSQYIPGPWEEKVRFKDLIRYKEELKAFFESPRSELAGLIESLDVDPSQIRILTTSDDFVNTGMQVPRTIKEQDLTVFPDGGHFGFQYEERFRDYLFEKFQY